jgi:hypothetical protein
MRKQTQAAKFLRRINRKLREMIFRSFPTVNTAELRMFRTDADLRPELMLTGSVNRTNEALPRVASVAMRARLCGFNFNLAQGMLERIGPASAACL